jgi:lysophospholipase L1-like esterase
LQIAEVNRAIARLHDGRHIFFLDIGKRFLDADGNIPREVMPDLLHPSEKGYQIWADAIRKPLKDLLK